MEYKQFYKWCTERTFDGHWGMQEAVICIDIIEKMKKTSILKRKSRWKEFQPVANEIVEKTNKKIEEVLCVNKGGLNQNEL